MLYLTDICVTQYCHFFLLAFCLLNEVWFRNITTTTTTVLRPPGLCGTTQVSQYEKGKTCKVKSICIFWSKR